MLRFINTTVVFFPHYDDVCTACRGCTQPRKELWMLLDDYQVLKQEFVQRSFLYQQSDVVIAIQVLRAMGEEAPHQLFMDILKDDAQDADARMIALFTLHDLGVQVPLEYFLLGLDLCYHGVDSMMEEAMEQLGEHAPIAELFELLGSSNNWTRSAARRSLENLRQYVPISLMMDAVNSDNSDKRKEAIYGLKAWGEQAPTEKLLSIACDESEVPGIRDAAIHILTELKIAIPLDPLFSIILDNEHPHKGSLERMAWCNLRLQAKELPLALVYMLMGQGISYDLCMLLGSMGEEAPVELMLSMLDWTLESRGRRYCTHYSAVTSGLAQLGKYAPVEAMVERLHEGNEMLQKYLLDALGELGEYAPIEVILRYVDATNEEVRQAAEMVLFRLSETVPATFVAEAAHDDRPIVRQWVLRTIEGCGEDAPVELAFGSLQHENGDVRQSAMCVLARMSIDVTERLPIDVLVDILQAVPDASDDEHCPGYYTQEYSCEFYLLPQYGKRVPLDLLLDHLTHNKKTYKYAAKVLYTIYPKVYKDVIAPRAEAILRDALLKKNDKEETP